MASAPCFTEDATDTQRTVVANGKAATGMHASVAAVEDSERSSDDCHARQLRPVENGLPHGESRRTLLVAYLPRFAAQHHVKDAFADAGICASRFVSIMRERGLSKCIGFVQIPTCDAARAALKACEIGKMVMKHNVGKTWHIKASLAKTETKDTKSTLLRL